MKADTKKPAHNLAHDGAPPDARALLLEAFGEAHSELVERVLFQLDASKALDTLFAPAAPARPRETGGRTPDPFDDPFTTFCTSFGEEPPLL